MGKRWARIVLWGVLSAAGVSVAAQAAPTPAAATPADKVERVTVLPGNGARIEVLVQG
ncbi:hydrolase, partial [Achromobacter xylosoxidans]